MLSPAYSAGFPTLLATLASGVSAESAINIVYHTPLDVMMRNLIARQSRPINPMPLPEVFRSKR